jgi:hypothetical protein
MSSYIHTTEETKYINIGDYSDPLQVIGKTVLVQDARNAPDYKDALQKLLWKIRDYVPTNESPEYVAQLKEYIANAERLLK